MKHHPVSPLISVLMSVCNEPIEWIKQSIDSILTQTFSDFEFIIINDNPERIELSNFLEKESQKDFRINLYTNPENIGLTKSLNKGLKLCRGKYIARMDADDYSFPTRLEEQVRYMEEHPEIVASSAFAYFWDGKDAKKEFKRPSHPDEIKVYIYITSPFIHPLLILRKNILDRYNIHYDENFRFGQDYKLAADLSEVGLLANLDMPLLLYRQSTGQISASRFIEQSNNAAIVRRNLINKFYTSHGLPSLPTRITTDTIKENYRISESFKNDSDLSQDLRIAKVIRRILYHSLSKYTLKSLMLFLISRDYCDYPYTFKSFCSVILKHLKLKKQHKII